MHEELATQGLTVITVALDRAADAERWIAKAEPTHPSLVDEAHLVAERYGMVNVPTVVWIDEEGRIARPNDVAFTTDQGGKFAGVSTAEQMARLRRWVAGEEPAPEEGTAASAADRSPEAQAARAHFGLGWWLHERGSVEAANRQFARAGELAPGDFTIRRGTMRLRDADPFGPDFMEMVAGWLGAGNSYYLPLRD